MLLKYFLCISSALRSVRLAILSATNLSKELGDLPATVFLLLYNFSSLIKIFGSLIKKSKRSEITFLPNDFDLSTFG